MFYSLTGKLMHLDNSMAVINCGGVGYKCFISLNTAKNLPKLGEEATVYTHLHVREDAMDLFGFATLNEQEFFKMLTNISGVGPKVGLAILSQLTPNDICIAASSGDSKAFARASGVGPKLAQRLVLELKDKVGKAEKTLDSGAVLSPQSSNATGAAQALMALGYSSSEAYSAVGKCDPSLKTEEIIRMSLQALAKR
ncbi:MAG: Holliday junction branch migration protein RuvA [Clostridia bacterium]